MKSKDLKDLIVVKIESKKLDQALQEAMKKSKDLSLPMADISLRLKNSAKENFLQGGRYGGGEGGGGTNKWQKSKAAIKRGGKTLIGPHPGPILMESIEGYHTPTSAMAATVMEYAAIHNFGGETGSKTKKNARFELPARPFMVAQD